MLHESRCCLCSQIEGDASGDLISKTIGETEYLRRIPMENARFAVIPSLGPLTRGHSLLCPKPHIKSFANLPLDADQDYSSLKSLLRERLGDLFKVPVHCFEHGSAPASSRILCTVEHAHLHFVPANVALLDILLSQGEWLEISPRLQDLSAAVFDNEYLYYETPDGRAFVSVGGKAGFESQYLRRVFVSVLNRSGDWDWRQDLRIEEVEQTYQDLEALRVTRLREHATP